MPIPFILMGLGAATAAVGVGTAIKAGFDQVEANHTNDHAKYLIEKGTKQTDLCRKNCNTALSNLGYRKAWVLDNNVKNFMESFKKIRNYEPEASQGLDDLSKFKVDKKTLDELDNACLTASSLIQGLAGGATTGALVAFGAYNGAMMFASASTGTAIASLSGAAATNATLAFFGGGSLATGGLGMAGGTAVLGGLVAGPALAVMGLVLSSKASKNLDNAYSNLAEAKEFEEAMKNTQICCQGIRLRTELFERLLIKLDCLLQPLVFNFQDIIASYGTDYKTYPEDAKQTIAAGLSTILSIKSILDTSILTEAGALTSESELIAVEVQKRLEVGKENTSTFQNVKPVCEGLENEKEKLKLARKNVKIRTRNEFNGNLYGYFIRRYNTNPTDYNYNSVMRILEYVLDEKDNSYVGNNAYEKSDNMLIVALLSAYRNAINLPIEVIGDLYPTTEKGKERWDDMIFQTIPYMPKSMIEDCKDILLTEKGKKQFENILKENNC